MKDKRRLSVVPSLAITMALKECHRYLMSIAHDDIDLPVCIYVTPLTFLSRHEFHDL